MHTDPRSENWLGKQGLDQSLTHSLPFTLSFSQVGRAMEQFGLNCSQGQLLPASSQDFNLNCILRFFVLSLQGESLLVFDKLLINEETKLKSYLSWQWFTVVDHWQDTDGPFSAPRSRLQGISSFYDVFIYDNLWLILHCVGCNARGSGTSD
jgi:hypothetical protein